MTTAKQVNDKLANENGTSAKAETVPETTIDSVLQGIDLIAFSLATQDFRTLKYDKASMRKKTLRIAEVIASIYTQGAEKGMKNPAIVKLINRNFDGITDKQRNDYKNVGLQIEAIKFYLDRTGSTAYNASAMLTGLRKYVDSEAEKAIEAVTTANGAKDVLGDNMVDSDKVVKRDSKGKVFEVAKEKTKLGSGIHIKSETRTDAELTEHLGLTTANWLTSFNRGKMTEDMIDSAERYAKSILNAINDWKNIDKMSKAPLADNDYSAKLRALQATG